MDIGTDYGHPHHMQLETQGAMLHVRLDRPEALNSLSLDMVRHLAAVLDAVRREDRFRLIVMTGSGPKAFCAGGRHQARRPSRTAG